MLKSIKIDDLSNSSKPTKIKDNDKKVLFVEKYLNGFAINESPEYIKNRYRYLVYAHISLSVGILVYSICFITFDQSNCPKKGKHNIPLFMFMPIANVIASLIGYVSMHSYHRYSSYHPIYAFIHCLLLGLIMLKTITTFLHIVGTAQDWFVEFDNDVTSKFWRSTMSWMSVIFMILLIVNAFCSIMAYILGKYGIFFFVLAYVLGKFVSF